MRREAVAGAKGGEGSPIRRKAKGSRFEGMRRVAGNAKSCRRFGVGIKKVKGRRECVGSSIWDLGIGVRERVSTWVLREKMS